MLTVLAGLTAIWIIVSLAHYFSLSERQKRLRLDEEYQRRTREELSKQRAQEEERKRQNHERDRSTKIVDRAKRIRKIKTQRSDAEAKKERAAKRRKKIEHRKAEEQRKAEAERHSAEKARVAASLQEYRKEEGPRTSLEKERQRKKTIDACRIAHFEITNESDDSDYKIRVKIAWNAPPGAEIFLAKNTQPVFVDLTTLKADKETIILAHRKVGSSYSYVDVEVTDGKNLNYYAWIECDFEHKKIVRINEAEYGSGQDKGKGRIMTAFQSEAIAVQFKSFDTSENSKVGRDPIDIFKEAIKNTGSDDKLEEALERELDKQGVVDEVQRERVWDLFRQEYYKDE